MRRHRDACIALLGLTIACAATARDQGFDVFLQRHALEGTRLQWQIDRLRNGNPAARVQAAREIAADPAMLASTSALLATERQAVLRDIVAQLPAGDRAAARPRLEMARQQLAEGAVLVESMRGTERDAIAAKTAIFKSISSRFASSSESQSEMPSVFGESGHAGSIKPSST